MAPTDTRLELHAKLVEAFEPIVDEVFNLLPVPAEMSPLERLRELRARRRIVKHWRCDSNRS